VSTTNFNYQVALKEGLKSLQQGRLRQAEQSFRYLVDKFPGAEGGYRGLAKVHFEQEDRTAALRVLRDGAAALTKSGERSAAIGLWREALALDPRDLATHRRLAAALSLAGDTEAAVQEYARFIRDLRNAGDDVRAKAEIAYALGQLRDVKPAPGLEAILSGEPAQRSGSAETVRPAAGGPTVPPEHAGDPWSAARAAPTRTTWTPSPPAEPSSGDDPWSVPAASVSSAPAPLEPPPAAADDPWNRASAPTSGERWVPPVEAPAEPASAPYEQMAPVLEEPLPDSMGDGQPTTETDPAAVEAAAARYLATRDPRAAPLALDAVRYYIDEGHTDAASDLLLQLIASGVADHDAQRLLVGVARTLGKRDVAKVKCQLLAQALLLDGRNDLAAEVEALAQAE
jgi:tetratricopeptide (TPR) repeat protein